MWYKTNAIRGFVFDWRELTVNITKPYASFRRSWRRYRRGEYLKNNYLGWTPTHCGKCLHTHMKMHSICLISLTQSSLIDMRISSTHPPPSSPKKFQVRFSKIKIDFYRYNFQPCPYIWTIEYHVFIKTRLFDVVDSCFFNDDATRKSSFLVISNSKNYFL